MYCPRCHGGDFPDLDHYIEVNHIALSDYGPAFAAWLHLTSGRRWDGDERRTDPEPPEVVGERPGTVSPYPRRRVMRLALLPSGAGTFAPVCGWVTRATIG
ncbi:hypothetical protein GCM10017788_19300 [Amycolatopsis acidiphila]|nr:hypothetical protein GCM10017788_19300 [Amycolatopsis acidiphila]